MSTWNVTEARAHLPEILQRVDAGDEVTLTRHGRAVAVIVRPDSLRGRRDTAALGQAAEIVSLLDELADQPAPDQPMTLDRADDLVAAIRADRDAS